MGAFAQLYWDCVFWATRSRTAFAVRLSLLNKPFGLFKSCNLKTLMCLLCRLTHAKERPERVIFLCVCHPAF
jgi:hypothetical protein